MIKEFKMKRNKELNKAEMCSVSGGIIGGYEQKPFSTPGAIAPVDQPETEETNPVLGEG